MPPLTADTLLDRLRAKFQAPAFAFLPLVRSNTGFTGGERYADAVAKKNLQEAERRFEEGDMPLFAHARGRE